MRKYYYILRRHLQEISRFNIGLYASNASFYIILSVFPTIMLMAALLPTFGIRMQDLLEAMHGVIPELLHPLFKKVLYDIEEKSSGLLLSATALVAIWSASKGVYCIRQGLNAIYGLRESRSYVLSRLTSMIYTTVLILSLILTLVVNGFGRGLSTYLWEQPVPLLRFLGALLRMRGIILLILLSTIFCFMYCIFPNRKQNIRFTIPGAVLAALSWLIFTEGYSYYARYSGSYPFFYGSLSTIAMGMVWLYICISILFYGCVLNIYLERR